MKYQVITLLFLVCLYAQTQSTCCESNTIKVSGDGKASALPDVAVLSLGFQESGQTSAEAVKALSAKVNQALNILKANGYGKDNYETDSLNVYPEYSYRNGKS